jgi:hypothetical protein
MQQQPIENSIVVIDQQTCSEWQCDPSIQLIASECSNCINKYFQCNCGKYLL